MSPRMGTALGFIAVWAFMLAGRIYSVGFDWATIAILLIGSLVLGARWI